MTSTRSANFRGSRRIRSRSTDFTGRQPPRCWQRLVHFVVASEKIRLVGQRVNHFFAAHPTTPNRGSKSTNYFFRFTGAQKQVSLVVIVREIFEIFLTNYLTFKRPKSHRGDLMVSSPPGGTCGNFVPLKLFLAGAAADVGKVYAVVREA